jgi:hydrogenase maturation protein HypF
VAALLGIATHNHYEGQAAIGLGFAAEAAEGPARPYPFVMEKGPGGLTEIDWAPMIWAILKQRLEGRGSAEIALDFHATLARMVAEGARLGGVARVALSGGCFQNRLLLEASVRELRAAGMEAHWQASVPTNDGGIALGQAEAAARGWIYRTTERNGHVPGDTRKD